KGAIVAVPGDLSDFRCSSGAEERSRRKLLERRAGHTGDPPVRQDGRAQRFVKPCGGSIPVQHGPFEPPAFTLHCNARQMDEDGAAVASTPESRLHEQVFEIEALSAKKRRKIVKKQ